MKEWELSFGLEGQPADLLQILRISHLFCLENGYMKINFLSNMQIICNYFLQISGMNLNYSSNSIKYLLPGLLPVNAFSPKYRAVYRQLPGSFAITNT